MSAAGTLSGERARSAALELLRALSEADGIPGHEEEVRAILRERLDGTGQLGGDRLGSLVCERRGAAEGPRIMVDCHLDEVGFMVQAVNGRGFVKFLPVGGWWGHVLLAQRVRIRTPRGKVEGVIGSTPPHLLDGEARKKVLEPKDMFMDVAARDAADARDRLGITPGCPIAPSTEFRPLATEGHVSGKAFDNRAGCAVMIQAMRALAGKDGAPPLPHPNTVIAVGSVQEEVGLRGATTSVSVARPDLAVVLEGTPADDTPGLDGDIAQGRLGSGVQLRVADASMICHPGLRRALEALAAEEGIPFQLAVRYSGGTDGGAIHKHGAGVPTAVLGVPVRYIHSHVGVLFLDDYLAALRLLTAFLTRCDAAMAARIAG